MKAAGKNSAWKNRFIRGRHMKPEEKGGSNTKVQTTGKKTEKFLLEGRGRKHRPWETLLGKRGPGVIKRKNRLPGTARLIDPYPLKQPLTLEHGPD